MKKLLIICILLLGISNLKAQTKIDTFVSKYLGAPYRWGGEDSTGIDCSGLTKNFSLYAFGIELPRTAKEQMKVVQKVPKDSLKGGDLVFFKSSRSPSGYHVGVYLHDGYYIHAASKRVGVIISSIKSNKAILMVGRIIYKNINAHKH